MDLLIDVGNTNLKWANLGPEGLGEMRSVRHGGGLPIDLHAAWELVPAPERVLVASVGGEALTGGPGERLPRTLGPRGPDRPHPGPLPGPHHRLRRARTAGVDRWLALLAAREEGDGPALVVDAGTAITYDLLLTDGRHLGGLILPGMAMMREGVLAGTRIPPVEPVESGEPWAADTAAAVAAASVQAPAALAERLLDRLAAVAGETPRVLLTGGDAGRLAAALHRPARLIPDLVLRGLALTP